MPVRDLEASKTMLPKLRFRIIVCLPQQRQTALILRSGSCEPPIGHRMRYMRANNSDLSAI